MDCGPINDIFKEAGQYIDKKVQKKKFKVANTYWGKVPEIGSWPLHSGFRIKKTRLGAYGFGNHDVGWEPVDDAICESDLCKDPEVDRLQHGGFESVFFGLERFRINSDWICLDKLLVREIPEDEIAHLEDYLVKATRYFWEEFYRSRYIDACAQKVVALVPADALDGDTCDCNGQGICAPEINTENGFVWERRSSGTIDERFIRVNVRVADITRISDFGLDMLDIAKIEMSYEDDNMPFLDEGIQLYDVIIGDHRQNIRFGEHENALMDRLHSYGGYDPKVLSRKLGTQMVWRNAYSVRYDNAAARFFPDVEFNDALEDPFDPSDPDTWPRFRRVFPWKPVRITSTDGGTSWGIKHVRNKNYIYAPFVINTIFSKMVISAMSMPTPKSIGKAKLASHADRKSYDGIPKWINPDWPCNPYGEKGYFTMGFGAAIKPEFPEYGWAYLTRMDHRISLHGNPCVIEQADCQEKRLTAYCYAGLAGDDADLNGSPGMNLRVPIDNYSNGW